jgi:hypothetical protein
MEDMRFGMRLRELWENRLGLAASFAIAILAAFWSVEKVSLFPPGIEARSFETASASTRVLVDAPQSVMLDMSAQGLDLESITSRALLVGNLINSAPVRASIARRVGIPPDRIEFSAPLTREWPRAIKQAGTERSTSDILKSPDQYRINVRANPTVPVIEISAQAPTAEAAERLANGAVLGTGDYLRDLGERQAIPPSEQIRIEQLGDAKGGVINEGVSIQVAVLSFMLALAAGCAAVLAFARIRSGWAVGRRGPMPAVHPD